MRVAIISDIHANLEALTAVLADIDAEGVDRIVCLGDVVGYGANPAECLALVRARAPHCVLGNHDSAVFEPELRLLFSTNARAAAEWTARQLDAEAVAWLRALPFRLLLDGVLFVHAAPSEPERWDYVFGLMEARMHAASFTERLCFIGHTHHAAVYSLRPAVKHYNGFDRFIINPGSVGQPRDGNPRASYGLLDTVAGSYENRRIEYDIARAAGKIIAAKLPKRLADRLYEGR